MASEFKFQNSMRVINMQKRCKNLLKESWDSNISANIFLCMILFIYSFISCTPLIHWSIVAIYFLFFLTPNFYLANDTLPEKNNKFERKEREIYREWAYLCNASNEFKEGRITDIIFYSLNSFQISL